MTCYKLARRRDLFAFPYPITIWKEPPRSIEIVKEIVKEYGVKNIYTVGDIVTNNFLRFGLTPTSAAVDEKTRREIEVSIVWPYGEIIRVKNPPGHITDEAWEAVGIAVRSRVLLKVDGEEDLLSLAFIKLAPPRSVVAYGHYAGALVVILTDFYRDVLLKLFDYLEKC